VPWFQVQQKIAAYLPAMNKDLNMYKSNVSQKPHIVLNDIDCDRLGRLALEASDRAPDVAETLLAELERATVLAPDKLPDNVVRMGSTVRYQTDDGSERSVTLVYPAEADIAQGRISILTPIGAALIGLSVGQAIDWTTLDERSHVLTILSVEQSPAD
jgi:regulator of nucleoside diphosphate kinase